MKIIFSLALLLSQTLSFSQDLKKIITEKEVSRIQTVLSSDDMEGRKVYTAGIEKAANFIAGEFEKAKLDRFPELSTYKQTFEVIKSRMATATVIADSAEIKTENVLLISTKEKVSINEMSNYTRIYLDRSMNIISEAQRLLKEERNFIIFVDTSHSNTFQRLKRIKRESFPLNHNVVFILAPSMPNKFNIDISQHLITTKLTNVIAMIPGKSKKDEFVIFSAHYDHLGIGKPNAAGDSIYNGANDDASGVTATIMLAKYFNAIKNNERTLIFVAFTAEETGGYGSRYFSSQINPDKVVAMFNIEMIGTESKWGNNNAFITGFDKSDMGAILQKNLEGSSFKFEPDPYPKQNLFYRSDNATLAALGVPAHTISTTKMDEDKFYHSQDDETETLDLKNMTEIIKAIAISSKGIVAGKDTPSRVEKL